MERGSSVRRSRTTCRGCAGVRGGRGEAGRATSRPLRLSVLSLRFPHLCDDERHRSVRSEPEKLPERNQVETRKEEAKRGSLYGASRAARPEPGQSAREGVQKPCSIVLDGHARERGEREFPLRRGEHERGEVEVVELGEGADVEAWPFIRGHWERREGDLLRSTFSLLLGLFISRYRSVPHEFTSLLPPILCSSLLSASLLLSLSDFLAGQNPMSQVFFSRTSPVSPPLLIRSANSSAGMSFVLP
eukprot:scaffold63289_cov28-Tisochrysis_lutea.AAC.6